MQLVTRICLFHQKVFNSKRAIHQAWSTLEREIKNGRRSLDIVFIVSNHNIMSQKAYCLLSSLFQHRVMVKLYTNDNLIEQIQTIKPDLIICPYLTRIIQAEIYKAYITLIIHSGSIDRWILERPKEWKITIHEANKEINSGPIWSEEKINTDQYLSHTATKSDAYHILTNLAMKGLQNICTKILSGQYPAIEQSNSLKTIPMTTLKQYDCTIDWSQDSASTIVRKIQAYDSEPGIEDSIRNTPVHLFGAHSQPLTNYIPTSPKTILAKDKRAILLSCADHANAVWITHLKSKLNKNYPYKLPATDILPSIYCHIPINVSFQDIHIHIKNHVCYIEWEFYNGVMRDDHCYRLQQTIQKYSNTNIKVIVLLGGQRYFSNGIDLNTIEAAENPVEQSQKYIHAMNNLIQYIMMNMSDKIIISVLRGHARAGGALMSQVADFVFIYENSIVNLDYKTMGLFGSEYWTFNLSSRLGSLAQADSLVNSPLPLDAKRAITTGFADFSFSTLADVEEIIMNKILPNINDHLKWKTEKRKENILKFGHPEVCRKREMNIMNENFYGFDYNQTRYRFVRKISMNTTPYHLLTLGQKQAKMMLGSACAEYIFKQIKNQHEQINKITPVLGCILIGSKPESELYVKIKQKTLREKLNFDMRLLQLQENNNNNDDDHGFLQKLQDIIYTWNQDPTIHGILIQLPLPDRLKQYQNDIIKYINPEKDVDGLLYPNTSFIPCAAQGIMWLLDWYDIKLTGKNVVVVGSSKLLGEPVSLLCKTRGATVTMCSIQTRDLREIFSHADIIITATGCPHLIHGDILPSNRSLVIVDAGVCYEPPFIRGDVDIDSVQDKCVLITPPTGAVGKITVAALAHNLFNAFISLNKFDVTTVSNRMMITSLR